MAICFAGSLAVALAGPGCGSQTPDGSRSGGSGGSSSGNGGSKAGGTTGAGGSSVSGGAGGAQNGGSSGSGGGSPNGGNSDASISSGGAGGSAGAGGSSNNGGASGSGGASNKGGAGGSAGIGGAAGAGGGTAGGSGSGGAAGSTSTTPSYFLPPPDPCYDRDYIPGDSYKKTGCIAGDASSECGGKCETASVCESPSAKPTAPREYMCPRNLLFSPEFEQAVKDDGLEGFHYAVVGHDPDKGGIDGDAHSCCQCYQLVYAYPSPANDRQVLVNPDNPNPPASAIPLPPPLIVQSFNTAATVTTFDVYMPGGGMGAQNGCFLMPNSGGDAAQRKYMYSNYPLNGQPGNGGVKPASLQEWAADCKTKDKNWVTEATLSSSACVKDFTEACNKITSTVPGLSEQGRQGCIKANTIDTFYHLNWSVYAMRIECPEHLTRVTGCKLAPQGLKTAKKDVKTAEQAKADPDFWKKTANTSNLYETTTMEDCCRPTCASYSQISGFGLKTDPQYRSFYNCDINGIAWTQKQ